MGSKNYSKLPQLHILAYQFYPLLMWGHSQMRFERGLEL